MSDALCQHLHAALATVPAVPLCVAYSGGPDSTALLHALAQLPDARARGLRALHVDHGLHAHSAAWAGHCLRYCATLQLPCTVLRVQVESGRGSGLEAARGTPAMPPSPNSCSRASGCCSAITATTRPRRCC